MHGGRRQSDPGSSSWMRQLVPPIHHFVFIDAPRPELYDVEADPGQKLNVVSQNQVLPRQYRTRLEEVTSRYRARSGTTRLPRPVLEARDKLAALGYVQISAPKIRGDCGKGVDPKDRIKAFESYHDILNEIGSWNIQTAMSDRLEALRKMAPEVRSLDFLEAQAFEALERIPEARRKCLQGLEIEPGNSISRAGSANLLRRMRRMNEAEREFRRVVANDPQDYRSRNNLAGIYTAQGRIDAALAELRLTLTMRRSHAAGWRNLGQLHVRLKNVKEAETALRKAVDLDRNNANAHFLLAQLLNSVGRKSNAADHPAISLKLDPGLARRIPGKSQERP